LRGVAVTDERGRFEFRTIRPVAYPDGSEPAHVHVAVMAPAHHARYLDYWFAGDPLITARRRREAARNPNTVIVSPVRGAQGVWRFRHDIRLQGN
jgi:protocatechuate 3,4-dioxygenase beta subunit